MTALPNPARSLRLRNPSASRQATSIVTRLNDIGLQRNPLTEEPEAPSVSVACGQRVHLLTHPIERLVVKSALVDAATVPVDRGRATVVSMVTAWWSAWTVAPPRICTGRSKADTEQSGNSDSGCDSRCRQRTFERHFLTPFLVDAAVLATRSDVKVWTLYGSVLAMCARCASSNR